jgi:hypothetical protein
MRRQYTAMLFGFGILAILGEAPARASELRCRPIVVEADAVVRDRWPELADTVTAALATRTDLDVCARVRLSTPEAATPDVLVEVELPDGRSTSRSVAREDIVPTLQALLVVPSSAKADAPPARASSADAASGPREANHDVLPSRPPPASSNRIRLELSVATGARVGDRQASAGLGLLSFVDISSWLAGFAARADYFQQMNGGPPGAAFTLAVLGGRRFPIRSVALDFIGGPALAMQESSRSVVESPAIGRTVTETDGARPRIVLGTRLVFRARSTFRPFIGLDGDFDVGAEEAALPPGNHRLPAWTFGLALGGTVGTL